MTPRRAIICVALVALCGALPAPAAQAEKILSVSDASRVTKKVARKACRRDENCTDSDAANCRRLAPRRVSCVASIVGADRSGPYQCDRLVLVRLRDDGELKHAVGKPSCYDVAT